tara:strand:+ start:1667 stop:2131 length:465 start_codon:yes stop_codon:yes gene_type:complete
MSLLKHYKENPLDLALDVASFIPAVRGARIAYKAGKYALRSYKAGKIKTRQTLLRGHTDMTSQINVLKAKAAINPKYNLASKKASIKNLNEYLRQYKANLPKEIKKFDRSLLKNIAKDKTTHLGSANLIAGVGTTALIQTGADNSLYNRIKRNQ